MDHVSRPMQGLLLATVAFAALWFVALRPKAPASEPPASAKPAKTSTTPTGQPKSSIPGGLGRAVDKAHDTKARGDAAAAAQSNETAPAAKPAPASAAKPVSVAAATPAAAKPAPAARPHPARATGVPAGVRHALDRGHVVVLLFYSTGSSDDQLVRGEVSGVSRRGGKVLVKSVPVRKLSRYQDVLRGVQVLQTPTVVVLRQGQDPVLLAGYTDRAEIDKVSAALLRRKR
jgi:hypothetical protein